MLFRSQFIYKAITRERRIEALSEEEERGEEALSEEKERDAGEGRSDYEYG